jgi:S-adenosylmethionine-diacylgycerolhomoserine-N-methlytransferase
VPTTAVQRFYRYHAYVYDSTRWLILHGREAAIERLALRPDSRVLEIGCGTGLNFRALLRRLDPARGRLTGLDFSADMLERAARRVLRHAWSNVELIEADAAALQLSARFDGILLAYSLSMIPDWPGALRRAYGHLRPGGRLVVLDFGRFDGWGPLSGLVRAWLRANHVETLHPYVDTLRELCGEVCVSERCGGYHFTAVARKRIDGSHS